MGDNPSAAKVATASDAPMTFRDVLAGLAGLAMLFLAVFLFVIAGWVFVALTILGLMAWLAWSVRTPAATGFFWLLIIAGASLMPHFLFLLVFQFFGRHLDAAGSLTTLVGFMEQYEYTVMSLHYRLDPYISPPLQWGFLMFLIVAAVAVYISDDRLNEDYSKLRRLLSMASIALIGATSFTVFSGLPTGQWSPSMTYRLRAALRESARDWAEREFAQALADVAAKKPKVIGNLAVRAVDAAHRRCGANMLRTDCSVEFARGAFTGKRSEPRGVTAADRDRPLSYESYRRMKAIEVREHQRWMGYARGWAQRRLIIEGVTKSFAEVTSRALAEVGVVDKGLVDALSRELVEAAIGDATERALDARVSGSLETLEPAWSKPTSVQLEERLTADLNNSGRQSQAFERIDPTRLKIRAASKAFGRFSAPFKKVRFR